MRSILFSLSLAIAPSYAALAGAWTQPEGEGQIIATFAYTFANDAFADDGQKVATDAFEKFELRAYGEYGLTDWATLVAQPTLRFEDQDDESVAALGRVDLGLRAWVWKGDSSVFSLEGLVSAPSEKDSLSSFGDEDTVWALDAHALFGHGFSLGWRHGFADLQAGYRYRFEDFPGEVLADLTLGLDVTEDSFLMVQSFNRIPVDDGGRAVSVSQEHTISISNVYRYDDRWSVQIGAQAMVYGRNILNQQGVFVGVWRKF